ALVQTRKIKRDHQGIKRALKLNFIDSAIALNLAFFVNAGILILAAAVFFKTGRTDVGEIKQAHELLAPMLGTQLAPILFAVALIAAGQSSTITGTLAGQIVMEGYLHLRIAPWMRRLITRLIAIIPAVIVILINGENSVDNLLIFSQVILSLQLGFAIIPLIHFTSDKKTMGRYAIKPFVIFLACVITAILVYLNMKLVGDEAATFFAGSASLFWKIFVAFILLSFLALLLIALIYPMRKRKIKKASRIVHPDASNLSHLDLPKFNKIAIALDFSKNDLKLISHAIGQGHAATNYLLIHIVESAATRVIEKYTDDLETRKDQEQLELYIAQLKEKNIIATGILGFNDRAREIARICNENKVDMLVIGAHGHKGIKDLLFGQTIDAVRHHVKIPVFVVNV
ncbi:MAG: divalent metal cation transporter, partial [Chitinophagaceae bacterium]|nr:divalent metal cation transporter [Chitinophagaceae bacterium]